MQRLDFLVFSGKDDKPQDLAWDQALQLGLCSEKELGEKKNVERREPSGELRALSSLSPSLCSLQLPHFFSLRSFPTAERGPRLRRARRTAILRCSLITLGIVKEPRHYSQIAGHGVPGVVVCPLWYIMVGRVIARRYLATQSYSKLRG